MSRKGRIRTRAVSAVLASVVLALTLSGTAYSLGSAGPASTPSPTTTAAATSTSTSTSTGTATATAVATPSRSGKPSPTKTPRPHPHKHVRPHPHKHPRPHPHKHPRPHPKRKPWPVDLVLRTVPALPGIALSLDGTDYRTGPQGTVTVTMEHDRTGHTLKLLTSTVSVRGHRYSFYRWTGQRDPAEAYQTTVTDLPWRADRTITVSFATECRVTPSFTDQNGARLDPASFSAVALRSQTGQTYDLSPLGASYLPCSAPLLDPAGPASDPIVYRLTDLTTQNTNVANDGQQAFAPVTDAHPVFTGYYYDLAVTAQDAFFGAKAGRDAVLTEPDGTRTRAAFSASGVADFVHLPRGTYSVAVGGGIGLAKTVRVSRDLTTSLQLIDDTDLAAGTACGLLFVLVPFLPSILRRRRRRRRPAAPAELSSR